MTKLLNEKPLPPKYYPSSPQHFDAGARPASALLFYGFPAAAGG